MNVIIDLSNASAETAPDTSDFQRWTTAALQAPLDAGEPLSISIHLVDEAESAELNSHYRDRNYPTNILSFPAVDMPRVPDIPMLLGDLAICLPVMRREAREQDKHLTAHLAHLTVHGTLHLQGYDHQEDSEAARMEALEQRILESLGFFDPYA